MIRLENLTYKIKEKTLIRGVTARFEAGKMHLILGPNGAGKSTLIKLIGGELEPNEGHVNYGNSRLNEISLLEQARRRAVLNQNLELSFPLSVFEVVVMGRHPHFGAQPAEIDIQICEESMQLFGVRELRARDYLTLSGGEKQRVQFARVFAQIWAPLENPFRVLLLDEPLTFLDIFYQYDLMNKIKAFMTINPDMVVIGVVHDLNIAARYADTVMLLKDKTIFDFGSPGEVLTEKNIFEVFGIVVKQYFGIG